MAPLQDEIAEDSKGTFPRGERGGDRDSKDDIDIDVEAEADGTEGDEDGEDELDLKTVDRIYRYHSLPSALLFFFY